MVTFGQVLLHISFMCISWFVLYEISHECFVKISEYVSTASLYYPNVLDAFKPEDICLVFSSSCICLAIYTA